MVPAMSETLITSQSPCPPVPRPASRQPLSCCTDALLHCAHMQVGKEPSAAIGMDEGVCLALEVGACG